jgi:hypothetical protein
MTTTLLLALFVAIVGRFMADEVKAWTGWLHRKLRRMAVAKLPEECRERYNEEWESGLDDIPGEIFKLIYSLGLLKAGLGIRKVALESSMHSRTSYATLKRVIDMVFSIGGLILLAPLLLTIAIAIKLDSPGPVFLIFTSKSVGKKGRIFRHIKFRTMTIDRDDPRITRLGRFLRRFSLDDLPLFFNVLSGDISIVGPRAGRS